MSGGESEPCLNWRENGARINRPRGRGRGEEETPLRLPLRLLFLLILLVSVFSTNSKRGKRLLHWIRSDLIYEHLLSSKSQVTDLEW